MKVGDSLLSIRQTMTTGSATAATAPVSAPTATLGGTTKNSINSSSGSTGGVEVAFKLADIGEGIAEVELMKWFVKEGDTIKSFDRICEVQSDKATVEITSRYDGVVGKLLHDEGQIVKVGGTLLNIVQTGGGGGGGSPTAAPVAAPAAAAHSSNSVNRSAAPVDTSANMKVFATPAVRKMAKENNVQLHLIKGTGPKGRIVKEDVIGFIQRGGPVAEASSSSSSSSSMAAPSSSSVVSPSFGSLTKADQVVPIRGVQRLMVKSMTAANTVPHLTYSEEVVFDKMKTMRNELNISLGKTQGLKLSYMPMMLKATSLALSQYPMLNATVNEDCTEVTYHGAHNIGVAMDTPKGLVVPVVRNVEQKSIVELAKELVHLQELGAAGKLTAEHLSGGTFSLSNIGSIGGTYVVPVLVVPQVVIGAMGRLQTLPRYVNSAGSAASMQEIDNGDCKVAPQTIMAVSWSADHRVVDGASVARFSNLWKSFLESPHTMMSTMR